MCGYCWGHSYVEGTGKPLPNSSGFTVWAAPDRPGQDLEH